jgi:hypothetical protein
MLADNSITVHMNFREEEVWTWSSTSWCAEGIMRMTVICFQNAKVWLHISTETDSLLKQGMDDTDLSTVCFASHYYTRISMVVVATLLML